MYSTFPIDVRATSGRVCTGLAHHECVCALTCAIACPLTLVKVTTLSGTQGFERV
jgi:hypothetical protein